MAMETSSSKSSGGMCRQCMLDKPGVSTLDNLIESVIFDLIDLRNIYLD